MNDKAKTTNVATGLILYRSTYTYAAKNGQLRSGSLIVEATDKAEAKKTAESRLQTFGLAHARITSTREY